MKEAGFARVSLLVCLVLGVVGSVIAAEAPEVPIEAPDELDAIVTYSMAANNPNLYHDGYADWHFDAWGYHALRWKAEWQNVSYSPANASPPSGWVWFDDDISLNDHEADQCVFPGGNPVGGWGSYNAFSFKELAVAAGLFMDLWYSPVYTNMYIGGFRVPVAIRSVTFEVQSYPNMQQLCEFWGWYDGNPNLDVEATIQSCAFHEDGYFTVEEMVISYWDPNLQDTLTITGETALEAAFPSPGDTFVGDPDSPSFVPRVSAVAKAAAVDCSQHQLPAQD